MRQVACPIALHPDGAVRRLAAFEHPKAGLQLVKGGVQTGEAPARAAARELFEEAGLETRAALLLGTSAEIEEDALWHFSLCRLAPPVREAWQHLCPDDGGQLFRFFWLPLDEAPPAGFDPKYLNALAWIRDTL